MCVFYVVADITTTALKAVNATMVDYAIVSLLASAGVVFLLTTGFAIYQV
jgi:hypothetical protein